MHVRLSWILIVFALIWFGSSAFAQMKFTVPNDTEYYVYDDGYYRYIYAPEARDYVLPLIEYNKLFRKVYEKEFSWQFNDRPTLVVPSQNNQITNGFATTVPYLFTTFYDGGADMIDYFTGSSWAFTLASHETSHLYQLNVQHGYSKFLYNIFGTPSYTTMNFLPPFLYTVYPNVWLPTFMMEGNATYNEGRFGAGGRLYSGHSRALLLQLIAHDEVIVRRLKNDHIIFPYGAEKYLIGGFFQLYLSEKYGDEKTNMFFNEHAKHMFQPFRVDTPFKRNFGLGYEQALSDMIQSWMPLVKAQKVSTGTFVADAQFHSSLSRVGKDVVALVSDGKDTPELYRFDGRSGNWSVRTTNIPSGRIFENKDGDYVAASAESISNDKIRFGLFREGYWIEDGTEGKVYYDVQKNQTLYADPGKSFLETQLYWNDKKIGSVQSSAVFGQDGKPYYFKQAGKTRTLYAGEKAIGAYRGYYGFPVDADASGVAYFIGPTESGSSLFAMQPNGRTSRVVDSDTVVDAKVLFGLNKAVVVEVTHENYQVKVVNLVSKNETPFEYKYKYEQDKEFTSYKPFAPTPFNVEQKAKEEEYSAFGEMQYTGMDPYFSLLLGGGSPLIGSTFNFSDPMQNHAITLGLQGGPYDSAMGSLVYTNMQYEVNWLLGAIYQRQVEVEYGEDTDGDGEDDNSTPHVVDRFDSWTGLFGILWPYWVRPQWSGVFSSVYYYTYAWGSSDIDNVDPDDNEAIILSQLAWSRTNAAPLGFYPHQNFSLQLAHEYVTTTPDLVDERIRYGGEVSITQDVFKETYITLGYQQAFAEKGDLELQRAAMLITPAATRVTYVSSVPGNKEGFYELQKSSVDLRQAINLGFYFVNVPLALRRFSLIGFYNNFSGTKVDGGNAEELFSEYGGGVELELLLLFKLPTRIQLLGASNNLDDNEELQLNFNNRWEF